MDAKLIAWILIGIGEGLVVSLVITPIFCFLRVIFYVPFVRNKLIEKAKRDGHVVEAHLEKNHALHDDDPIMKEMGTYVYCVNGKKYKYRYMTELGNMDKTIRLFYIKNPRKATVGGDLGNRESPWLKSYLIISLIIAIVTAFVGMIIC